MKSSLARGRWAFNHGAHRRKVDELVKEFAARHGLRVHCTGNAGNHLHLYVRISDVARYPAFIRALSAALVFAVTGHSRWNKVLPRPFFDHRPFTRVVGRGRKAHEDMKDYLLVNEFEGRGFSRGEAEERVGYLRLVADGFFANGPPPAPPGDRR